MSANFIKLCPKCLSTVVQGKNSMQCLNCGWTAKTDLLVVLVGGPHDGDELSVSQGQEFVRRVYASHGRHISVYKRVNDRRYDFQEYEKRKT